MKIMFVWEDIYSGLTSNYHSGGGCVVIADSFEEAKKLLLKHVSNPNCEIFTTEPSYSAPTDSCEDKVFIFPDAGCC